MPSQMPAEIPTSAGILYRGENLLPDHADRGETVDVVEEGVIEGSKGGASITIEGTRSNSASRSIP